MGTYSELLDSGIDFAALLKREEDEDDKKGESLDEIKLVESEMSEQTPKNLLNIKQFDSYLSKSYDPSGTILENCTQEIESRVPLEPDIKVDLKKSKLSKSLHSLSGLHADRNLRKARSQISIVRSVDNLSHGMGSTLSLDDHILVSILPNYGENTNLCTCVCVLDPCKYFKLLKIFVIRGKMYLLSARFCCTPTRRRT